MIDYSNIRRPIVIISTPRSGSTALTLHMSQKIGPISCFIEPEQSEESLNEFLSHAENNKNYLVKIHVDNLFKYPKHMSDYLMFSNEPYRILIKRKSQIDQLLSFYIETYRKRWAYAEGDAFKKDVIPNNISNMQNIIEFYNRQNEFLDKGYVKFDSTLTYEDCVFENTGFRKTPKPKNYQELYDTFTKVLEGKIK